jgi:hypothetical protein
MPFQPTGAVRRTPEVNVPAYTEHAHQSTNTVPPKGLASLAAIGRIASR